MLFKFSFQLNLLFHKFALCCTLVSISIRFSSLHSIWWCLGTTLLVCYIHWWRHSMCMCKNDLALRHSHFISLLLQKICLVIDTIFMIYLDLVRIQGLLSFSYLWYLRFSLQWKWKWRSSGMWHHVVLSFHGILWVHLLGSLIGALSVLQELWSI
jgi:hypothetical protein